MFRGVSWLLCLVLGCELAYALPCKRAFDPVRPQGVLQKVLRKVLDPLREMAERPIGDVLKIKWKKDIDVDLQYTTQFPGFPLREEAVPSISRIEIARIRKLLQEEGGDLRFENENSAFNSASRAGCHFDVTESGMPYVLLNRRQLSRIPHAREVALHEIEHFFVWREIKNELLKGKWIITENTLRQAGALAKEMSGSPWGIVYNESRAVSVELTERYRWYRSYWKRGTEDRAQFHRAINDTPALKRGDFSELVRFNAERRLYPLHTGISRAIDRLAAIAGELERTDLRLKFPETSRRRPIKRLRLKLSDRRLVRELLEEEAKLQELVWGYMEEYIRIGRELSQELARLLESSPSVSRDLREMIEELRSPLGPEHPLTGETLGAYDRLKGRVVKGAKILIFEAELRHYKRLRDLFNLVHSGAERPAQGTDFWKQPEKHLARTSPF